MTRPDPTPVTELAALYLAGALPFDDLQAFEDRRAAGWPEVEAELHAQADAVRALAADCDPVAPSAGVKAALLAAVADPKPDPRAADRAVAATLRGVVFKFADDAHEFRPTETPGISVRKLHIDRVRSQFSCLVRMAPGSSFPAHPHDGGEECVVLEGEVTLLGVRMRAGDYQRFEAGVPHGDNYSATGALVYVSAPLALMGT